MSFGGAPYGGLGGTVPPPSGPCLPVGVPEPVSGISRMTSSRCSMEQIKALEDRGITAYLRKRDL
jgi:hypothetical protein